MLWFWLRTPSIWLYDIAKFEMRLISVTSTFDCWPLILNCRLFRLSPRMTLARFVKVRLAKSHDSVRFGYSRLRILVSNCIYCWFYFVTCELRFKASVVVDNFRRIFYIYHHILWQLAGIKGGNINVYKS